MSETFFGMVWRAFRSVGRLGLGRLRARLRLGLDGLVGHLLGRLGLDDRVATGFEVHRVGGGVRHAVRQLVVLLVLVELRDRKSTRLNSSHVEISYAVFCLKKKNEAPRHTNVNAFLLSCTVAPF